MLKRLCLGVAILLGVMAEANGLFMLYSPTDWDFAVPGVTTTGPFNQHFVRDIGLTFLFVGTAFLVEPPSRSIASFSGRPPRSGSGATRSSISGKLPSASAGLL